MYLNFEIWKQKNYIMNTTIYELDYFINQKLYYVFNIKKLK